MRALGALAIFAACGHEADPSSMRPLWSDGTNLRDPEGRVALLRGVNARVDGVFDVTFGDGRMPLEPVPPLVAADCHRMRQLGFDLLRLPINWSAIEPARGSYDEAYLVRVDAAIACAADAGMLVLVDLHQDAYSKEIGEDGAPAWAIVPAPPQLLGGPLTDLGDRRLSGPVQAAFHSFFDTADAAGLQVAFAAMFEIVARRWAQQANVVGFELFNEPDASTAGLEAFHARVAAAVRDAAPGKLVFFEPPAFRNLTDFIPRPSAPFPIDGAVYAPHIYTFVFNPDQTAFRTATPDTLEPSVQTARDEATAFHTPLFIGEFGAGATDDAQHARWTQTENQLADRYLASNAFWLWKEMSQASWGLYDHDAATGAWTERPHVVSWVSRFHAARIAGTPTSVESSAEGDAIHVEIARGTGTAAPHLIFVPERYAALAHASCDGVDLGIARDVATGLAELACTGALDVRATP